MLCDFLFWLFRADTMVCNEGEVVGGFTLKDGLEVFIVLGTSGRDSEMALWLVLVWVL